MKKLLSRALFLKLSNLAFQILADTLKLVSSTLSLRHAFIFGRLHVVIVPELFTVALPLLIACTLSFPCTPLCVCHRLRSSSRLVIHKVKSLFYTVCATSFELINNKVYDLERLFAARQNVIACYSCLGSWVKSITPLALLLTAESDFRGLILF